MGPASWDTSELNDWSLVAETFPGSIVDASTAKAADAQQVDWLEQWEGWTSRDPYSSSPDDDGGGLSGWQDGLAS